MSEVERPLVTFALFAYNQDRFVHEAITAALQQSYTPLEIILSDDASTDQTASIIASLVNKYEGPHKVQFNINSVNLGIGEHVNKIMGMANGELIVMAAGDDVSNVDRTEILVKEWKRLGRPPALCSDFQPIDANGIALEHEIIESKCFMPGIGETQDEILKRFIKRGTPSLIGCTEAWRKDLVDKFPCLIKNVCFEDKAYSFRAWLLGGVRYIPHKLVKYRKHNSNFSLTSSANAISLEDISQDEKNKNEHVKRQLTLLQNNQHDLDHFYSCGLIEEKQYVGYTKLISKELRLYHLKFAWWNQTFTKKIFLAIAIVVTSPRVATLVWVAPRLLPFKAYAFIKLGIKNQLKIFNRD